MQRHRILVFFAVAWVSALVLSWWVYRKATAPAQREWIRVVAATRDLSVGKRLAAPDLKLVEVERKDLPQGAYTKISDLVDRAVVGLVLASELVLERKLAPKGGGEGLTALIEPGMRAVSVQVNDTSGVAGFVQPGTRVDVVYVRLLSNGDAAATTILQNVRVLAYGRQLEPGGKVDVRAAQTGQTVATLLVTQDEAERLVLALQRGKIQLALRNPLDTEMSEPSEPVRAADLGIADPVRTPPPPPRSVAAPAAPRSEVAGGRSTSGVPLNQGPRSANDGRITVRVFRGSKVSEDVF